MRVILATASSYCVARLFLLICLGVLAAKNPTNEVVGLTDINRTTPDSSDSRDTKAAVISGAQQSLSLCDFVDQFAVVTVSLLESQCR